MCLTLPSPHLSSLSLILYPGTQVAALTYATSTSDSHLSSFFHFILLWLSVTHSRNLATAQMVFLSHQIYVDYVVRFGDKVALDEITLYASCYSFLRLPSTNFFILFYFLGGVIFSSAPVQIPYLYSTLPPSPADPILPPPQTQLLIIVSPSLRLTPLHRSNP